MGTRIMGAFTLTPISGERVNGRYQKQRSRPTISHSRKAIRGQRLAQIMLAGVRAEPNAICIAPSHSAMGWGPNLFEQQRAKQAVGELPTQIGSPLPYQVAVRLQPRRAVARLA